MLLNKLISYIHFCFSGELSCVISINTANSEAAWKTVQIFIIWLHHHPADLIKYGFIVRKHAFWVCGKVRLNPAYSGTETS